MINYFEVYMHINAFLGININKAMTKPNRAHMYSDQG